MTDAQQQQRMKKDIRQVAKNLAKMSDVPVDSNLLKLLAILWRPGLDQKFTDAKKQPLFPLRDGGFESTPTPTPTRTRTSTQVAAFAPAKRRQSVRDDNPFKITPQRRQDNASKVKKTPDTDDDTTPPQRRQQSGVRPPQQSSRRAVKFLNDIGIMDKKRQT
jgi:hypothetical protein